MFLCTNSYGHPHLPEAADVLVSSNQTPLICFRYVKPRHFSTSEFLSDVTTPEGVRYLQPGYPKLEREDFIASFLLSPTFRDIRRVVDSADPTREQVWVQVSVRYDHILLCSSLYILQPECPVLLHLLFLMFKRCFIKSLS